MAKRNSTPITSSTPIFSQRVFWVDASGHLPLDREPERVWTIANRAQNDEPKLPMQLNHRINAFLEDPIHDYVWVGTGLRLHRRTGIEKGVWVVVEYDETPTAYMLEVSVSFKGTAKKVAEARTKTPESDLEKALADIVALTKNKIGVKPILFIFGEAKIVRHGPGWWKDTRSYGTTDQRADATLKLRTRLHEAFPEGKDGIAYDWNDKQIDEEWADVNTYAEKQKESVTNGSTVSE